MDMKIREIIATIKIPFNPIFYIDLTKTKKAIVVDTSSLEVYGAVKFIMSFPTVILLEDVLMEMDKFKRKNDTFGRNIKKILYESAQDPEGAKYKSELSPCVSQYGDDNILAYCKEHKDDVILYTGDNVLASRARGYGIEYVLAREKTDIHKDSKIIEVDEDETHEITGIKNKEASTGITQLEAEELKKKMQNNSVYAVKKTNIPNTSMIGNSLVLKIPKDHRALCIVLKDDNIKPEYINNCIKLERDDIVLITTNTIKHEGLCVFKYRVTDTRPGKHAYYLGLDPIGQDVNKIENLDFPIPVKREIHNYFMLVRKII